MTVCGIITGDRMKFITICDHTGIIECELFADTCRRFGIQTVRSIAQVPGINGRLQNVGQGGEIEFGASRGHGIKFPAGENAATPAAARG